MTALTANTIGVIRSISRLRFSYILYLTIASATFCPNLPALAADRGWDYQPYKIRAIVAIDLPGGLSEQMAEMLPAYLQRRANAAIGLAWSLDVELAAGALRQRLLSNLANISEVPPAELRDGDDKLVLITVRRHADGFELAAREFDCYVARWSTPILRETQQEQTLPEQTFALLWQTVAPLAQFDTDAQDPSRVVLKLRGAALAPKDSPLKWIRPGDVYLPVLRHTTRSAKLIENGIQPVPWTYLEVVPSDGKNEKEARTFARIHSGTRRPFGARRQGRIEQVAIAVRSDLAPTTLHLQARTKKEKPLVGYEIFFQTDDKKPDAVSRIGTTDLSGNLSIPPGETRVRTLYIKNGGQLLGRLPIVPGAAPQIDVPLPDDDPRLAAEAKLAAMREDLVDVVARRNILMARARQKIEKNDFAAAQKLLTAIDELPDRQQFNLNLTSTARMIRSEDPQIQRRIDQLFEATQTVLAQYLDLKPISDLHEEFRQAQKKDTAAGN